MLILTLGAIANIMTRKINEQIIFYVRGSYVMTLDKKTEKKKELKKAYDEMSGHVKLLSDGNPHIYSKANKVWDSYTKGLSNNNVDESIQVIAGLGKFVFDSIPHVITAVSEDKTKQDILDGKFTKQDVQKRIKGLDAQSALTRNMIKSAVTVGSNPNNNFAGDLFSIVVGVSRGSSAVEFAIKNNSFNGVKALLDTKGDTDNLSNGNAPIHNAFGYYNRRVDPNEKNADLLQYYMLANRKMIQKYVVDKTKDVNIQNSLGENVLHVIADNERLNVDNKDIIDELVKKGVDVNHKDMNGFTPLHVASNVGNSKFIDTLSDYNVSLEAKNKYGQTPLHIAALADEADCFESLLKMGVNPNKKDIRGKTAFYYFENDKHILKIKHVKDQKSELEKAEKRSEIIKKYKDTLGVNVQKEVSLGV